MLQSTPNKDKRPNQGSWFHIPGDHDSTSLEGSRLEYVVE
jgi:hypothetical protein